MNLRVAGAQMAVTADICSNVAALRRAIDAAAASGADILLTPEGSLSGYRPDFDPGVAGAALAEITARARDARIGLALGTCFVEPDDGACCNEIRFYNKDGRFLGYHTKILRCGSLTDPPRGEINAYAARPLRTYAFEGLTIGGLICNDLWANPECTPMDDPHLTQRLSRLGARVIFHAVNGGRDDSEGSRVNWRYHEANLRMRARAGRVWIVTVDSAHPVDLPCSAPGGVVAPDGSWTCRADPVGEQLFVHTIALEFETAPILDLAVETAAPQGAGPMPGG